jgi:small subunit ribosomal protein S3
MGNKLPLFNLRNNRYAAHWHATKEEYPRLVELNYKIRKLIYDEGKAAKLDISNVIINGSRDIRIDIHTVRPGLVLGKSGANITLLKNKILAATGLESDKVHLNLISVTKPELDARLIAMKVAGDLEKRRSYNYSMRSHAEDAIRFGALGIHIRCSGRLNGVDIARDANEKRGKISKSTIRANMYYALEHAVTRSGLCGVKVWLNLPPHGLKRGDKDIKKPDETLEEQKSRTIYRKPKVIDGSRVHDRVTNRKFGKPFRPRDLSFRPNSKELMSNNPNNQTNSNTDLDTNKEENN